MGMTEQQQQQHSMMSAESSYLQQQQQAQHDQKPSHESELHELEISGEFDAFPHNEECTAVLTMKCGEPLMAVRKKLHDDITITFIPEEGFGVFQSKVERHYSKLGKAFVQEKRAIYLKPSSNATQTKYVLLTENNFDPLLRMRWKIARSMKVDLKYEVFAYFVDMSSKKEKKRLSMKMFHHDTSPSPGPAVLPHAEHFAGFAPSTHGFPLAAAQTVTQAIQSYADLGAGLGAGLGGKPISSGSNSSSSNNSRPTSSALLVNGRDESERPRKVARTNSSGSGRGSVVGAAATAGHELDDEPFFQAIPFRINGFVVPLEVDVSALRRALGLSLAPSATQVAPSSGDADLDAQTQAYDR